ncbi:MAG TPA: BamA/TamA family outer membrane protein [Gemmatimonadaceae bacterium]|nr:BamA/TamA family outer membrane protein [Gemmatimonadaceae bacterium]
MRPLLPAILLLGLLAAGAPAGAQETPPRAEVVQVRESRALPRDVAEDIASIFNTPGARRVDGDFTVPTGTEIQSDLAVLSGTLTVAGRVNGRVVAVNGDVVLEATARLGKDLTILGGRLDSRDGGEVLGDVRVFTDRVAIAREADRLVVSAQDEPTDDVREPRRRRRWGNLRLVSARTYNRVEGLPLLLGPVGGREFRWGRVEAEALGILRSTDRFRLSSDNLGHSVQATVTIGRGRGVRFGGRLFDVVEPVEAWHLSDSEVGVASFLLHRDYRDYYSQHGQSLFASAFTSAGWDVSLSYSDEGWGALTERDPWTLFRDTQTWRANPQMDVGHVHVLGATVTYDTRNDPEDPWTGWHVAAGLERGYANLHVVAPTSSLTRSGAPGRYVYDRGFLDLRRYNRVSPEGQLNFRLALGGWLHGDELPLQRRFFVGGAGTLPGYDFRRRLPGTDYLTCSSAPPAPLPGPVGSPAECERFALAQLEYRGDIRIDPLGFFRGEREQRRFGWGRGAEWVVFIDAGRGWLVGPRVGDLRYPADRIPPLGTFRADVGLGFKLDDLGIYLAKAVTDSDAPVNLFVRLQPRF